MEKKIEKKETKIYMKNSQRTSNKKVREDLLLTETESLKKYIEKLEKNNETDKNAKNKKKKKQKDNQLSVPQRSGDILKILKLKPGHKKLYGF